MQVTSFQKALLGVAGAVGLAGGTAGLLLWRGNRKDGDDAAYRAKDMPVDTFVDRVLSDYDTGTYVTPFVDDHRSYEPDGTLTIGAEQSPDYDATLHREFVDKGEEYEEYDRYRTGQRFLVEADADDDGHVSRTELRAAVDSFAGGDGTLSASERRTVLVDEGLAELVPIDSVQARTSWDSPQDQQRPVVSVSDMARDVFYKYGISRASEDAVHDGKIRIDRVGPSIPWDSGWRERLVTGEIGSMLPNLTAIDTGPHGDRDGAVSQEELAHWIADEYSSSRLSYGHVDATVEEVFKRLHGQVLGRIEADTLQGHAYLSTTIPPADLERFYGGDLGAYIDASKGVRVARGPVEWVPEPARPEAAREPRLGGEVVE